MIINADRAMVYKMSLKMQKRLVETMLEVFSKGDSCRLHQQYPIY